MHDAFNLERFVAAQETIYPEVLLELERGHKRTHWMWFIFPQHVSLGMSATAKHFGIHSLQEAKAYLRHSVLGARLQECCGALMKLEGRSAHDIFGSPDDMKLRSCLTLFELAAPGEGVFAQCLEKYFAGRRDERTLAVMA